MSSSSEKEDSFLHQNHVGGGESSGGSVDGDMEGIIIWFIAELSIFLQKFCVLLLNLERKGGVLIITDNVHLFKLYFTVEPDISIETAVKLAEFLQTKRAEISTSLYEKYGPVEQTLNSFNHFMKFTLPDIICKNGTFQHEEILQNVKVLSPQSFFVDLFII